MSFKGFSFFRSGGQFVQWSRTILAILVEGHPRNIPVELFEIWPLVYQDMSFKAFSILSSGAFLLSGAE